LIYLAHTTIMQLIFFNQKKRHLSVIHDIQMMTTTEELYTVHVNDQKYIMINDEEFLN
jgi:hypothetical protein